MKTTPALFIFSLVMAAVIAEYQYYDDHKDLKRSVKSYGYYRYAPVYLTHHPETRYRPRRYVAVEPLAKEEPVIGNMEQNVPAAEAAVSYSEIAANSAIGVITDEHPDFGTLIEEAQEEVQETPQDSKQATSPNPYYKSRRYAVEKSFVQEKSEDKDEKQEQHTPAVVSSSENVNSGISAPSDPAPCCSGVFSEAEIVTEMSVDVTAEGVPTQDSKHQVAPQTYHRARRYAVAKPLVKEGVAAKGTRQTQTETVEVVSVSDSESSESPVSVELSDVDAPATDVPVAARVVEQTQAAVAPQQTPMKISYKARRYAVRDSLTKNEPVAKVTTSQEAEAAISSEIALNPELSSHSAELADADSATVQIPVVEVLAEQSPALDANQAEVPTKKAEGDVEKAHAISVSETYLSAMKTVKY